MGESMIPEAPTSKEKPDCGDLTPGTWSPPGTRGHLAGDSGEMFLPSCLHSYSLTKTPAKVG